MKDTLQENFNEVGKDLETRWIELSKEVRKLSAELKVKSSDLPISTDVAVLSGKTERLCDHVERIHADVIDLLENLDTKLALNPEGNTSSPDISCDEIEHEKVQIQREQHSEGDIKDIIKALFMYVDDPAERVAQKK